MCLVVERIFYIFALADIFAIIAVVAIVAIVVVKGYFKRVLFFFFLFLVLSILFMLPFERRIDRFKDFVFFTIALLNNIDFFTNGFLD